MRSSPGSLSGRGRRPSSASSVMEGFNDDVLHAIFSNLPLKSLISIVPRVNTQWRRSSLSCQKEVAQFVTLDVKRDDHMMANENLLTFTLFDRRIKGSQLGINEDRIRDFAVTTFASKVRCLRIENSGWLSRRCSYIEDFSFLLGKLKGVTALAYSYNGERTDGNVETFRENLEPLFAQLSSLKFFLSYKNYTFVLSRINEARTVFFGCLRQMPKLICLEISTSFFKGIYTEVLALGTALEVLVLRESRWDNITPYDDVIADIGRVSSLLAVTLENVGGCYGQNAERCRRIRDYTPLMGLPRLQQLNLLLHDNKQGVMACHPRNLDSIRVLRLKINWLTTSVEDIRPIINMTPKLRYLRVIYDNTLFQDSELDPEQLLDELCLLGLLKRRFAQLRRLDINSSIKPLSVVRIKEFLQTSASAFPLLTTLEISSPLELLCRSPPAARRSARLLDSSAKRDAATSTSLDAADTTSKISNNFYDYIQELLNALQTSSIESLILRLPGYHPLLSLITLEGIKYCIPAGCSVRDFRDYKLIIDGTRPLQQCQTPIVEDTSNAFSNRLSKFYLYVY